MTSSGPEPCGVKWAEVGFCGGGGLIRLLGLKAVVPKHGAETVQRERVCKCCIVWSFLL